VAAADILQQVRHQVCAALRPVDQVMVRIDDRQGGIERVFPAAVEPFLAYGQVRVDLRADR
jgi:hypothetical protein